MKQFFLSLFGVQRNTDHTKKELLYAIHTMQGKLLSYNPADDTYQEIADQRELKVWDYFTHEQIDTWFKSQRQPQVAFEIKELNPQPFGQ